jgi:uncharacterized RDD family membrane protein YckC
MAVVKVPTNFNIDVEFEIPEFYRRLIALLIDMLIIFFWYKIAVEILSSMASGMDIWDSDNRYNLHWLSIVLILFPITFYHVIMEITMGGQSIGKKIVNIKVVNENGGKASISQYFIRWLLRDIWFIIILIIALQKEYAGEKAESTFLWLFVLAYFITDIVLVVSSKKGQRIGDILAKTILIRINTKSNIEDTVFIDVADSYVPSFPQIMQLSDKDINAIKSILETARKKGDFNMVEAASYKIKTHLKIESNMPPFDFLDVLLKDYNYLSTK